MVGRRVASGFVALVAGVVLALMACAKTYTQAEVNQKEARQERNWPATERGEEAASKRIQMEGGVNAEAIDDEADEVVEQAVGGPEAP